MTKTCRKCKTDLPLNTDHFHKNKVRTDGFEDWCKPCKLEDSKQRRIKRDEKGVCHCGRPRVEGLRTCAVCIKRSRDWSENNPEAKKAFALEGRRDRREIVFSHYGKQCVCCGESHWEFLELDHIAGGGTQHRKQLGAAGTVFYAWIIRNGFPEGYRTLCSNCNKCRGSFGYCPHERERDASATLSVGAQTDLQAS